jgi:hypothetical protein
LSIFKRIFGGAAMSGDDSPMPKSAPDPTPTSHAETRALAAAPLEASSAADILRVDEVADAEFYAGDLFRRRFGHEPPSFPRHYVAFYRASRSSYWPVGYVHYTEFEDMMLCGGMVIDDRLYRRLPAAHRSLLKQAGGIAETMLRETFARLRSAPAIWGYVGDKQAEAVDLRAGFRHTHHPHVMVVWNHELPEAEKSARIERVIALGPF